MKKEQNLQLLTRKDVAGLLKISERKVDLMREEGKLQTHKVDGQIRFKQVDIEAYIESTREIASA